MTSQFQHTTHIQALMSGRVGCEIFCREPEQGSRRREPIFLEVDKRPRELDESFVESIVRSAPAFQPEILEHIVSFVEKSLIETLEVTQVAGIEILPLEGSGESGDFGRFMGHGRNDGTTKVARISERQRRCSLTSSLR